MKIKSIFSGLALALGLQFATTAQAADILCQDPTVNHMLVSDTYVSACLDAGVGNLTGNPANDLFLNGVGSGYEFIVKDENSATLLDPYSFNAALWNTYSEIAIGFKFGTGNRPDEWFVYSLQSGVSTVDWTFVNVFNQGGGLSHVNLYGGERRRDVPEPATLALVGLGLLGAVAARRRRQR